MPPPRPSCCAGVADADGLLCLLTERVDAALLDAAPELRVISNFAVGADNVDVAAATARGIPVGDTPDVLTERRPTSPSRCCSPRRGACPRSRRRCATGVARPGSRDWLLGPDVHGATLGDRRPRADRAGGGERAAGFGMEVVQVGRGDDPEAALARADFVSLHAPLTARRDAWSTRRVLGAMKPTPTSSTPRAAGSSTRTRWRGRCTSERSRARRSTSPTPSRCRPTIRCSRRRTSSSSPTSARPRTRRASGWPTSRSTTSSPDWRGSPYRRSSPAERSASA